MQLVVLGSSRLVFWSLTMYMRLQYIQGNLPMHEYTVKGRAEAPPSAPAYIVIADHNHCKDNRLTLLADCARTWSCRASSAIGVRLQARPGLL